VQLPKNTAAYFNRIRPVKKIWPLLTVIPSYFIGAVIYIGTARFVLVENLTCWLPISLSGDNGSSKKN
jgi:hypothetical protein